MEGHKAETAQDGAEALQMIELRANSLDAIIIDYNMPGMNGLEVVKKLRQREEKENLPRIPIILFTGDVEGKHEWRAQELGVARVLYKPLIPKELITITHDVVHPD
jgi:CheY-like chemotaxis protein